jgi:uncharacterized SAM-dependent methyltransferase
MHQFSYFEVLEDGYGLEAAIQENGKIYVWTISPPNNFTSEDGRQFFGQVNTVSEFIDKFLVDKCR